MLDIARCFDERQLGGFEGRHDELLDYLVESGEDEFFFLTAAGTSMHRPFRALLDGGWHLRCSLDMGRPFANTRINFAIYGLSKKASATIKVSNWHSECGSIDKRKMDKPSGGLAPLSFSYGYKQYWAKCEAFVNSGALPKDDELAEFVQLLPSGIDYEKMMPAFYTKKNRGLRKKVRRQDTIPLEEVAEILEPRTVKDAIDKVPVIRSSDMRYPFDEASVEKKPLTTVPLKNGDIVITRRGISRIFAFTGHGTVFAGPTQVVVRPNKGISPEYLYLYLTSDFAKDIFASLGTGCYIPLLRIKDIKAFPIVIPKQNDQFYKVQFRKITEPKARDYLSLEELTTGRIGSAEEILDRELADAIKAFDAQQLRDLIEPDIQELNTCFKYGAYKAAIILAGSVLEAVLIDWLSAINGKNYFVKNFTVPDRRRKGHTKRADLIDYIDVIEGLEKPNWMDGAKKAHEIRKKRNLVHAKLCIAESEVTEKTARMVIDYLKYVIEARIKLG